MFKWQKYTFLPYPFTRYKVRISFQEVRRALLTQQQNLEELVGAEKQLEKLLADYEKLTQSGSDAVKESAVNPEQVIDDYGDTCDLVRANIANLQQIIAVQVSLDLVYS